MARTFHQVLQEQVESALLRIAQENLGTVEFFADVVVE
jgi:hypothetical protein